MRAPYTEERKKTYAAIALLTCLALAALLVFAAIVSGQEEPDNGARDDQALQLWAGELETRLQDREKTLSLKALGTGGLVEGAGFRLPPGAVAVHTRHASLRCTPECDKGCDSKRSPPGCAIPNCGTVIDFSAHVSPVASMTDAFDLDRRHGATRREEGCIRRGGGDHGFRCAATLAERCLRGDFPPPPAGYWSCRPTREEAADCEAYFASNDPFFDVLPKPPVERPPATPPAGGPRVVTITCRPCPDNPNPGVRSTGRVSNVLLPPARMSTEIDCPCGVEP